MLISFFDRFFRAIDAFCRILLMMIFVVMWIVVFGRYFLGKTPVWGEELVLFCMVWLAMLSGAGAFRKDMHIKITILDNFVPERFLFIQSIIYDVITTAICCVVFRYAVKCTVSNMSVYYMGLKFSEGFAYLAMPVGYGLIVLTKVEKYYRMLTGHKSVKEEEAEYEY